MWKTARGTTRLWQRSSSLNTSSSVNPKVSDTSGVLTIPKRSLQVHRNNPTSKKKVDTAMQLVGRHSMVDAQEQGVIKASASEKRINTKIGWVKNKLENYTHYSLFTTEQVEDLDECFRSVRFASSQEMWRNIMNMWYFWGRSDTGDAVKAADMVNGYMKELMDMSTTGAYNLARTENDTKYPQHMIKFQLRARSYEYEVAMRANEAANNPEGVLALWDQLSATRNAIPDPASLPPPLLSVGPLREKEWVQRRMMGERRQELIPFASVDARVLQAALSLGKHDFIDKHMYEMLTDRASEPSLLSHSSYIRSLQARNQHLAVIEHIRTVLLRLSVNENPNPKNVNTLANGAKLDTTIPEWVTTPALRSQFAPDRTVWLHAFKSLLAMYPPPKSIVGDEYNYNKIISHKGEGELAFETNEKLRNHVYQLMKVHNIPVQKEFFQSMLETSPNADVLISYVNDMHHKAESIRDKVKANPPTPEEIKEVKKQELLNKMTMVDLNTLSKDAAFKRTFGRYIDEAKELGLLPETYKTVTERLVRFLAEEYAKDEETVEKEASHFTIKGKNHVEPFQSPKASSIAVIQNENKDIFTKNAGSNQSAQSILSSITTIRNNIMAYGVPVNSDTETAYIRSLILLGRKSEDFPYLTFNRASSVLPVKNAIYSPASYDTKLPNGDIIPGSPLMNFKDRLKYIKSQINKRKLQLNSALQEFKMIEDSIRAFHENQFGDGVTGPRPLDPIIIYELIDAFAELAIDSASLYRPFDPYYIAEDETNCKNYQIPFHEAKDIHTEGRTINVECMMTITKLMESLAHTLEHVAVIDTHHIPFLENGKVCAATYYPLLRVLATCGDYLQATTVIEGAHQNQGIIPTTETFNLLASAFINSPDVTKASHAVGVLDLMQIASNSTDIIRKPLSDADISRAVIHGSAEDLVRANQTGPGAIYPDGETISLLIRGFHKQGKLKQIEELWRRLIHRPLSSWTSFSAIEEEYAVSRAIVDDVNMDNVDNEDQEILDMIDDFKLTNEYEDALNTRKNPALRELALKRTKTNVTLPSILPRGSRRSFPKGVQIRLDAPATTSVVQSFIQLGHIMHAIQIYIDHRELMPDVPFANPVISEAMASAIENNRILLSNNADAENELKTVRNKKNSKVTALTVKSDVAVRVPLPREVAAKKHLQNLNLPLMTVNEDETINDITKNIWMEADTLASIAVFAQKQAQKYASMTKRDHLPTEAFDIAAKLETSASEVIALLADYTIQHPYLPGDSATSIFYTQPNSYNNFAQNGTGLTFTTPSLLLPFIESTEHIYAAMDVLVLHQVALEETLFKVRNSILPNSHLQRWYGIYPTVINQVKGLRSARDRRIMVQNELERLRGVVDRTIQENKLKRIEERSVKERMKEEQLKVAEAEKESKKWMNAFTSFLQDKNALDQLFVDAPKNVDISSRNILLPPQLARVKETTSGKADLQRKLRAIEDGEVNEEIDLQEAQYQLMENNVSHFTTAGDIMLAPADLSLAKNASEQVMSRYRAHKHATLKGYPEPAPPTEGGILLDLITDYKTAPALLKEERPGGFHTSPYGPYAEKAEKEANKLELDYARATFSTRQSRYINGPKKYGSAPTPEVLDFTPREMREHADNVLSGMGVTDTRVPEETFTVSKHGSYIGDRPGSATPLSMDYLEQFVFKTEAEALEHAQYAEDDARRRRLRNTSHIKMDVQIEDEDDDTKNARPLKGTNLFRSRSKTKAEGNKLLANQRARLVEGFKSVAEVQSDVQSKGFHEDIPMSSFRNKSSGGFEAELKKNAIKQIKPKEAWASAASSPYSSPPKKGGRSTLFD